MSLTPDAARSCAGCSTPLDPGAIACSTCGHVAGVSATPHPGPPVRPPEPASWTPAFPPPTPMIESAQRPTGPPPFGAPPTGATPWPPVPGPALPPPYGYPGGPVRVVAPKSPGIAVVLSIWLGVGHLYVGENGLGFGLLAFYLLLCLLSFVPILWILTIPVWFIAFIFVAMNASKAANNFNRRNGIVVH